MSLPSLPEVPRERRRSATVVAVAFGAVLCLIALVVALKGLFAPPDGSGQAAVVERPGTATSTRAVDPTTPAGSGTESAPADAVGFSSPSGNIDCRLSAEGARCDIRQRDWKPPAEARDCELARGRGLSVGSGAGRVLCAGDTVDDGAPLGYGKQLRRGDFACRSSTEGVRCVHLGDDHGFELSRADYRVF